MLEDALVIVLYITLIIFVISLTVLCIRLIGTLKKADKLIDNVNKKVETLDGIFNVLDFASSKLSVISESVISFISSIFSKLSFKRKKEESEEDYE